MPDTVLVTGATGGLGGAVVHALEGAGWMVAALGSDDADLTDAEDTARAVGAIDGPAAVINLDGGFSSGPKVHEHQGALRRGAGLDGVRRGAVLPSPARSRPTSCT